MPLAATSGSSAPIIRRPKVAKARPSKPTLQSSHGPSAARFRGQSIEPFLLLPGAHAVGHAFVEVGRPDDRLYARKPQPLSDFVAHASEGEGDALALQLFDRVQ